ncbi:sulfur oxidation protein SoxY [Antarctobacter heliothermus]|uniref:Sulfur oxidation protein SoxY n=1 Tax=Antarctobacter heliothermus TaxID=74033 RepID=A0A222E068_9RHOB|nr:quinoprotein dehydrogenase-associated SoxYZ-like carrier [Antarctobacter heliothermus]ASP19615.1 sulfur oxidation protein SoxY [Antarctobacter heliothermus]
MFLRTTLVALLGLFAGAAIALDDPQTPLSDPMQSGMWDYHQKGLLGDPADIRFDDRVVLRAPASAEDSLNVPLLVDATAIPDVKRIVVSADYGPIPHILTYYPDQADAKLSLRFKIDQATAIRASVETHSGAWHVGSIYIDAAGGGCTAPAHAYANDDWEEKLGEVHGRLWSAAGRARLIVDHPMDTGLADGIPVFIIQDLSLQRDDGTQLARLELAEPVNEDPAFTFYFAKGALPASVKVVGRDNNGNRIRGVLSEGDLN